MVVSGEVEGRAVILLLLQPQNFCDSEAVGKRGKENYS